ncbi:MAG: hypothetical protein SGI88_06110 [Candidatus Hydrogenedentes bacterium]|nr:hypothetical protein [Candidatus Hydrogenedentota bacterium]
MPTLIDDILALENQASAVVATAQAQAETIMQQAGHEVASARNALAAETAAKLTALETEINERCRNEEVRAEEDSRLAIANIERAASTAVQQQAAKIAAAFTQG